MWDGFWRGEGGGGKIGAYAKMVGKIWLAGLLIHKICSLWASGGQHTDRHSSFLDLYE